jgi:hypothetical protein
MPLNVGGIDPDEAVHQAQGEPADAALGEVGSQHRRPESAISSAGGDRGAELEPDRLQDLVQPRGEVLVEQVDRCDIDQLGGALERCEHVGAEARRGVTLAGDPLSDVTPGVEQVGDVCQLPHAVGDEAAIGVRDPRAGAPGSVDAQQRLQGGPPGRVEPDLGLAVMLEPPEGIQEQEGLVRCPLAALLDWRMLSSRAIKVSRLSGTATGARSSGVRHRSRIARHGRG